MEGERRVTRSVTDELHSWDIQGHRMEGGRGGIRSIIDELHSWDIQGYQMEGQSGLPEVSVMNFILPITNSIKWKVKVF